MKDRIINKALYNMIYIDICGFPQRTRKSSDKLNHLPMDVEYKGQSNGLDSLPRCNQFLTTVSTILIIIRHGKVPWTRERRPRSCARTGGAAALRERDAAAREGIDAAAA